MKQHERFPFDHFVHRHVGSGPNQKISQLKALGHDSMMEMIADVIPADIRLDKDKDLSKALTEFEYLQYVRTMGKRNKEYRSFIGLGYYQTITPSPILRNVFENPAWYTPYTPYQSEIAQGRLEALLNFQTMVTDLTGMEIANASLLDEATAAAEAMIMLYRAQKKKVKAVGKATFVASENCFPQTLELLKTRATPLDIELLILPDDQIEFVEDAFGVLLQYPAQDGRLADYAELAEQLEAKDTKLAVAADLMALCLLKPPGEWGADVVVGNTQRFGIPLGYGGPHAAYFATKEKYKRQLPGRIIGVSEDAHGNQALRMALQTREQHIRREKATSNICTAQALLASMAGMYAVYHGPVRLREIAKRIHLKTVALLEGLQALGLNAKHDEFFDTIEIEMNESALIRLRRKSVARGINFRYRKLDSVGLSLDETVSTADLEKILAVFAETLGSDITVVNLPAIDGLADRLPSALKRSSHFMQHPVFHTYHSEVQMMRYIKSLERKDIGLNQSMIPLGSCTMKLNAATQLIPLSWPCFANIHPFVPYDQAKGYHQLFEELEEMLCQITGFDACSLQPNSGAQGEFAGLMTIRNFHLSNGDDDRNVIMIPASAHGTNPASAILAGMKVVVVKCDEAGNIDLEDLTIRVKENSAQLAGMMITYPSTHGVFEVGVKAATDLIHQHGGRVYLDGANMNAQVGFTNPALVGADVCHLNLHKTFAIPHGGGGPGMGPICCTAELGPYLPGHGFTTAVSGKKEMGPVSAAPWGSASILLISHAYIRMLGWEGMKESTAAAILNANYIRVKLQDHFEVLYTGEQGHVAHELILDLRPFKKSANIDVADVAKRLMDYGYHAPTVSFPVPGTIMIEPTESEDQVELDQFCSAMIGIREEIAAIENEQADIEDNVLKNAPHLLSQLTAEEWTRPYSRTEAAWPKEWVKERKLWPTVGRIDEGKGDRNLICSCPSLESYQ